MRIYISLLAALFLNAVSVTAAQAPPRTCDSVSALLDTAEKSNNVGDREYLLGTLRTAARADCATVFLGVLQGDGARDIQEFATEILVALGNENVIAGIVDVLHQKPNPAVRTRLASVIENISTPSAAKYLGQALIQNRDETLWASVPLALGRIGTAESVRQLVAISSLSEETGWPYIVRGFALIRNEDVLIELRKLFESDARDPIRQGVALALENYDKPEVLAAIESYLRTEAHGKVREALQVSSGRISERAIKEPK